MHTFVEGVFRGKAQCSAMYKFIASLPRILHMGRLEYVCATCEEHFTRRYSATRHNITVYGNRAEIVSLLEYLVGRSSGRYRASYTFWYKLSI
jgi:hypothetical protein